MISSSCSTIVKQASRKMLISSRNASISTRGAAASSPAASTSAVLVVAAAAAAVSSPPVPTTTTTRRSLSSTSGATHTKKVDDHDDDHHSNQSSLVSSSSTSSSLAASQQRKQQQRYTSPMQDYIDLMSRDGPTILGTTTEMAIEEWKRRKEQRKRNGTDGSMGANASGMTGSLKQLKCGIYESELRFTTTTYGQLLKPPYVHPNEHSVSLHVNVDQLPLNNHNKKNHSSASIEVELLKEIVGKGRIRYNKMNGTSELTLKSNQFGSRIENKRHVVSMLDRIVLSCQRLAQEIYDNPELWKEIEPQSKRKIPIKKKKSDLMMMISGDDDDDDEDDSEDSDSESSSSDDDDSDDSESNVDNDEDDDSDDDNDDSEKSDNNKDER